MGFRNGGKRPNLFESRLRHHVKKHYLHVTARFNVAMREEQEVQARNCTDNPDRLRLKRFLPRRFHLGPSGPGRRRKLGSHRWTAPSISPPGWLQFGRCAFCFGPSGPGTSRYSGAAGSGHTAFLRQFHRKRRWSAIPTCHDSIHLVLQLLDYFHDCKDALELVYI